MHSVTNFVIVERPLRPSLQQPFVDNLESPEEGTVSQAWDNVNSANIIPPVPVTKPRRSRIKFTSYQLVEMEKEYQIDNYCKPDRRIDICMKLNLTETQVKDWFQNRRTKSKKENQEENQYSTSVCSSSPDEQGSYSQYQPISPPIANAYPTQDASYGQHTNNTGNEQQWGMSAPVQNFQTHCSTNWNQYNNASYDTESEAGYIYQQGYAPNQQYNYHEYQKQWNCQMVYNNQRGCYYQQGSRYHEGYNGTESAVGYIRPNDVNQQPHDMYNSSENYFDSNFFNSGHYMK